MTYRKDNHLVICEEAAVTCSECKRERETRPYGIGGARLCFKCAMSPKNKATTERNFGKLINSVGRLKQ